MSFTTAVRPPSLGEATWTPEQLWRRALLHAKQVEITAPEEIAVDNTPDTIEDSAFRGVWRRLLGEQEVPLDGGDDDSSLLSKVRAGLKHLGINRGEKFLKMVADELKKDLDRPPRIVIIGDTGAGKSSTINALFNAGAPVGHVRPTTAGAVGYEVTANVVAGSKGKTIEIVDMPGLGETLEADESHLRLYREVLPTAEVILWILDASTRTLSSFQRALREVVQSVPEGLDRLVIGLNKIDKMEPGLWNVSSNTPRKKQRMAIDERIADLRERIGEIANLPLDRIVPYSAKKNFQLKLLFKAMMDAIPKGRGWVLHDRADIAPFTDLVDPEILARLKKLRSEEVPADNTPDTIEDSLSFAGAVKRLLGDGIPYAKQYGTSAPTRRAQILRTPYAELAPEEEAPEAEFHRNPAEQAKEIADILGTDWDEMERERAKGLTPEDKARWRKAQAAMRERLELLLRGGLLNEN